MYYDGTKLLSLMDIDGNKPEIFITTSNRSAGKTTYFNRLAVRRFLKHGEKFAVLYRYKNELANCSARFFKDIQGLFFPNYDMTEKSRGQGSFMELMLNDQPCGYALAINAANKIKHYSHLLSDVSLMIFDEFQSEDNVYCQNEVQKVISIHTSIARGQGQQIRYVPLIMISNPVTLLNPYYVELGISQRLTDKTRYLKGQGFVLEQGFNASASKAQINSGFNKAFAANKYVDYSSQAIYLNDNSSFIENMSGISNYLATIRYNGRDYAIKEYQELGIIYCTDRADKTYCTRLTVTVNDHDTNYVMLQKNSMFISNMRYLFEHGCFRFKNLECKNAILKILSY